MDCVIGVDIAKKDSVDYSVVSEMCLNCKTVIHIEVFEGEKPTKEHPKVCPNCGIEFKGYVEMTE